MDDSDQNIVTNKDVEKQQSIHENEVPEIEQEEQEEYESDGEERDEDNLTANDRKILKRMEKYDQFIHKVTAKIRELENTEIPLDELGEKETYAENILKERFVKAYEKLRKICKDNPHLVEGEIPKKPPTQFSKPILLKSSSYPEINDKLTKILNLKENKKFPDYADILNWINQVNTTSNLKLNKEQCEDIAKSSFKEIGNILKKRRKIEQEKIFQSYIDNQEEMMELNEAEKNQEVIKKLELNKKVANEKEEKILQSYAEKSTNEVKECETSETGAKSDNEDDSDDSEDESQASCEAGDSCGLSKQSDDNEDNQDKTESTVDPDDYSSFDEEEENNVTSAQPLITAGKRKSTDTGSGEIFNKKFKPEDSIELKSKFTNNLGISILSAGSINISELIPQSVASEEKKLEEDDDCIVLD